MAPCDPPPEGRIPWEERRDRGLARAFADTLTLSIRDPKRLYALTPSERSVLPAIAYGLVFEVAVSLVQFAYDEATGSPELGATLARVRPDLEQAIPGAAALAERFGAASPFISLLTAPLGYLVELVTTAFVAWIGLRLTRNLRTSFGTLVRLFAYASWVRLFGLLAVPGELLSSILAFVLTLGFGSWAWLVLVRESQRIETTRAVVASLAGTAVMVGLGCVLGVPLIVGLAIWALSSIDLTKIAPP